MLSDAEINNYLSKLDENFDLCHKVVKGSNSIFIERAILTIQRGILYHSPRILYHSATEILASPQDSYHSPSLFYHSPKVQKSLGKAMRPAYLY